MHANTSNRARAAVIGLIALLLAASCALALSAADADAVAAKVLGQTKKTPKSKCTKEGGGNCQIVVHVTTVQTVADGKGRPFVAPADGHIVAWSTSLGNLPSGDGDGSIGEQNELYGDPVARLSVLKPKGHSRFKLARQSPKVELEPRFGTNPIIALGKPLKVKAGMRIGLTIPHWAPNFTDGLASQDNQFLASRENGKCGMKYAKDAKPHQKQGSTRSYGCRFNGSRVLYWAYFVPRGKK